MSDDWKIEIPKDGDWFGYGGSRIGRADSMSSALDIYGPKGSTLAKASAIGGGVIAAGGYLIRQRSNANKRKKVGQGGGPAVKRHARRPGTFKPRQAHSHYRFGWSNHLSKMRRRVNRGGRRKRFRKRRTYRKRGPKRSRLRRGRRGVRKPSWAKAQIMGSKPTQFMYNTKFGIEGTTDRCLFFCPMFDVKNVCDSTALGTGAGYLTYLANTTPEQWPAMLGDCPQQMFAWGMFNNINDSTELKRRYLWGPRQHMWEITNQETFPFQMSIIWCRPRRAIDYNSSTFTLETFASSATDCNDLVARAFAKDSIFTYGTGVLKNELPISFSPFHSHTFCQLFKVVKVQKVRLDAGQCAVIRKRGKGYRSIGDFDVMDPDYVVTRRQLVPFISVVGCPVYDSTNIEIVGTGKVRLSMVYTSRFPWWTMNSNTQSYVKADLAAPAGALTPANARYVSKPVAAAVSAL